MTPREDSSSLTFLWTGQVTYIGRPKYLISGSQLSWTYFVRKVLTQTARHLPSLETPILHATYHTLRHPDCTPLTTPWDTQTDCTPLTTPWDTQTDCTPLTTPWDTHTVHHLPRLETPILHATYHALRHPYCTPLTTPWDTQTDCTPLTTPWDTQTDCTPLTTPWGTQTVSILTVQQFQSELSPNLNLR